MKLEKYIETIGGQTSFAKAMGVSQGLVWQWINGETRITAERALEIERVSGGAVTKNELRPDIFGDLRHKTARAA